ncbi:unnamed protein product, partial [Linum tenue]
MKPHHNISTFISFPFSSFNCRPPPLLFSLSQLLESAGETVSHYSSPTSSRPAVLHALYSDTGGIRDATVTAGETHTIRCVKVQVNFGKTTLGSQHTAGFVTNLQVKK